MSEPAQDIVVDLGELYLSRAYQYAEDVRAGNIPVCRLTRLAVDRWFRDLDTAGDRGLYFDENAAARVFRFSGYCRQYEGQWAGQTLELQGWQCFIIANVFGWMRADGTRRFRIVYEEIPRKNGKTTKLGFIGNYGLLGDNEPGPRVYSAATKRDQASELFDAAQAMVEQSPELLSRVTVFRGKMQCQINRGRFLPLSADHKSMDGLNVHFGLVDELHAHPSSRVWDVIKSARGARRQALIWAITTAGFDQTSICYEQRGYAIRVLEGTVEDDSYFAVIYTVDDESRWSDEKEWRKANPNWGVSINIDDMRDQARLAKEIPSERVEFLTKRLNVWLRGETKWMNMERWNDCAADYDDQAVWSEAPPVFEGRAYAGLDLSSVEDMTALSVVVEQEGGGLKVFSRAWLPEEALNRRLAKGDYSFEKFEQAGVLHLTPGETVDYDYIRKDVLRIAETLNLQAVAFDRWNSNQLVNQLLDDGVPMVSFGQGYGSMSSPMKELMRLVLNGQIEHSNPVLTWAVGNLVTDMNPAGDVKPAKDKCKEKIDPAVALVMALGMWLAAPEVLTGWDYLCEDDVSNLIG